jgi:hypothetical protein
MHWQEIGRHRQAILDRRGGKPLEIDLAEMIEQMREERDGELITGSLAVAVDASYIVRMLLPVEQATITLDQFANWRRARVDICALDILIADVTSVIRQAVYRQWITAAEGQVRSTVCWKNFRF